MLRSGDIKGLVEELKAQNIKKYDVITPSSSIELADGRFNIKEIQAAPDSFFESLQISTTGSQDLSLNPTSYFHSQVAEKLGIPKNYYDKCNGQGNNILADNVNYWLQNSDKNYMVRSFKDSEGNGTARAFLSDRFKTIDNWDVLITALEEIKNNPNIVVEQADLSETKMYVSFYDPSIEANASELLKNYRNPTTGTNANGDSIISGFTLSNSELGSGGYTISPRGIILACRNGMTQKKDQLRRVHLGEKHNAGFVFNILSKGPSVLIRIYLFLSSFLIKYANFTSGSILFSLMISIPKNKPEPLTSPIQ